MVYFIHDKTSRAIKIGCAWDPDKRLSTLQISTSNALVLLGAIAGMKSVEKKVHELVFRHCAPKPEDTHTRPLCIQGEWFDDRILPFVTELMNSPKQFLDAKKKPADRAGLANRDRSLHQCKIVLSFDSGETYCECFVLRAGSPDEALAALGDIAYARLTFLARTVRITQLTVPGLPSKKVSLQGAIATQICDFREGLSVILNSEPGNGYATIRGIKQYSIRWFHGVPEELCEKDVSGAVRPKARFQSLLDQFTQALIRSQCVISAITPRAVQGIIPRKLCSLPRGELRSKANRKAAGMRKRQRPAEESPRPKHGVVYFIQDRVTLAIKIGFCLKEPEKRLAALQTGNSNALSLLCHVPGSVFHERTLHTRFFRSHIQGEWFSNAIIADIEGIMKCKSVEEWLAAQDSALPQQDGRAGEAGLLGPS